MFLLFLIVLGTAGVKAQVRIGGNTAPSASAVLDLNASDAANLSTGGLVLPRVDLKTNVMQLTTGITNQIGTMVYNVTTTLGRIGVYYWNGNSWVLASLPSTSAADSGKMLMSNGSTWVAAARTKSWGIIATWPLITTPPAVTWTKVLQQIWQSPYQMDAGDFAGITVSGLLPGDLCYGNSSIGAVYIAYTNTILQIVVTQISPGQQDLVRCYRPSA